MPTNVDDKNGTNHEIKVCRMQMLKVSQRAYSSQLINDENNIKYLRILSIEEQNYTQSALWLTMTIRMRKVTWEWFVVVGCFFFLFRFSFILSYKIRKQTRNSPVLW